jgi:hypothetical protein
MTMNPLVLEYQKRLRQRHAARREVLQLLITCIHEAGHWAAYAHCRVYVCSAYVMRDPGSIYYGCVTATKLTNLVLPQHVPEVDYVCTVAGPRAEFLLTGEVDTDGADAGDRRDAEEILFGVCGEDPLMQGELEVYWNFKLDAIIGGNWRVVEALAYELMRVGTFEWNGVRPTDIERKYGIGYGGIKLSTEQQAAARRELAAFHDTPEQLARVISSSAAANTGRTSSGTTLCNAYGDV